MKRDHFGWKVDGGSVHGPYTSLASAQEEAEPQALVGVMVWERKPPIGRAKVSNVIRWNIKSSDKSKPSARNRLRHLSRKRRHRANGKDRTRTDKGQAQTKATQ